jgi:TusA-related sulfurtransferase
VLAKKFFNIGFEDIEVRDRQPIGLEVIGRYPLLTEQFVAFLRAVLPPSRHDDIVYSAVLTAGKPARREAPVACPGCRFTNAAGARFCNRCGARLPESGRGGAGLPEPDALLDLGAGSCEAGGLLKARALIGALAPGQVMEVRSTDPVVADEVPAWCRMTGHDYLGAEGTRYFVRKR